MLPEIIYAWSLHCIPQSLRLHHVVFPQTWAWRTNDEIAVLWIRVPIIMGRKKTLQERCSNLYLNKWSKLHSLWGCWSVYKAPWGRCTTLLGTCLWMCGRSTLICPGPSIETIEEVWNAFTVGLGEYSIIHGSGFISGLEPTRQLISNCWNRFSEPAPLSSLFILALLLCSPTSTVLEWLSR